MRLLVAGLHFTGAWQKGQVPTTGAISQARQRLGSAPLQPPAAISQPRCRRPSNWVPNHLLQRLAAHRLVPQ